MVSNVDTIWFSNGDHVVSMLTPHGFHVLPKLRLEISLETTNFMVSLLSLCHFHGFDMDTM